VRDTGGCDVITQVDRKVSHLLRAALLRPDEGWLCEEDVDNPNRLSKRIVWLVDPLDGAREFSMVFRNGASRSPRHRRHFSRGRRVQPCDK
jgi:fructose-1,6-bisphosphatase/inositol monophosphatase family enzyme